MERILQPTPQSAKHSLTMLIVGCLSLSIAAVGIVMTHVGTVVLLGFVGSGCIIGGRRLARHIQHLRYERQRQQEALAHRKPQRPAQP